MSKMTDTRIFKKAFTVNDVVQKCSADYAVNLLYSHIYKSDFFTKHLKAGSH